MKGIYFLLLKLEKDQGIDIGSLGELSFRDGYYVYIGSAQNGIKARVRRHLREEKKKHWHIDYLLDNAEICRIYYVKSDDKKAECRAASFMEAKCDAIDGFGSSDCSCRSHLIHIGDEEDEAINTLKSYPDIKELDMKNADG